MNNAIITKRVMTKLGKEKTFIQDGLRLIYAGGVYRVIQIANKKPYVAITAFRKTYSLEQNRKRNKELLGKIKDLGLYAYNLIGFYKECPEGNPDCDAKEKVKVEEESFFIPYREDALTLEDFIQNLVQLGSAYQQDTVLVGLPNTYPYKDKTLKIFNYDVEVGSHYYLTKSGIDANIGKKITHQKLEDYGSIALDPKKDRKIEWLVTGVLHPINVMSRFSFKSRNLIWCEGLNDEAMSYINLDTL